MNIALEEDTAANAGVCLCLSMDEPIIRLRPHHALCIRHYTGKGYSDAFMENLRAIVERLNGSKHEMVQIILHRDSLCAACPRDHDGICEAEEKVRAFDRTIAVACGLRSGQWLSWAELCALIDTRILSSGGIKALCSECEGFSVCEKQLP